jgi:hypothetical protein
MNSLDMLMTRRVLLKPGRAVGAAVLRLRGVEVEVLFESVLGPDSFELLVAN